MSDVARRHGLPPGGTRQIRAMRDGWPVRTMFWPGRDPAKGAIDNPAYLSFIDLPVDTVEA